MPAPASLWPTWKGWVEAVVRDQENVHGEESGFRIQDSGFRIQDSEFRIQKSIEHRA
ncbi:hypothetical protein HC891_27280 [Candidatus Gracilibacteria bacterium]|nr:hypothetical protein [Candidatus Gracilibacteria bacterium]